MKKEKPINDFDTSNSKTTFSCFFSIFIILRAAALCLWTIQALTVLRIFVFDNSLKRCREPDDLYMKIKQWQIGRNLFSRWNLINVLEKDVQEDWK